MGEPVDVGRFGERAAVAADVAGAEVVGQDEDDVWRDFVRGDRVGCG